MVSESITPTPHRVHAALIRPVLFAGVEYAVAITEGTLVVALLVGVGLHLATIALAVGVLTVGHPVLVRLTARDPQLTQIYLRSLRYADYYSPAASLRSAHGTVAPSIPRLR